MWNTSVWYVGAHQHIPVRLVNAQGRSCCCYDAMATAPWEASDELNEFCPQLKWSSRRHSGHSLCRGTATPAQGRPLTHYMETQGHVCVLALELAVSWRLDRFLTHLSAVAARSTNTLFLLRSRNQVRRRCFLFFVFLVVLSFVPATQWTRSCFILDRNGWENLNRFANDDVGAHASCRYDTAGGGPGEAGGAGVGALWRYVDRKQHVISYPRVSRTGWGL